MENKLETIITDVDANIEDTGVKTDDATQTEVKDSSESVEEKVPSKKGKKEKKPKEKKEKAPKVKKEKTPKDKKEKAPKVKKEKTPKDKKEKEPKEPKLTKKMLASLAPEDQIKAILDERKKKNFHVMNFSRKMAVFSAVPLIVLGIIISILSARVLTNNLEQEVESSLKIVATSLEETYSNLYIGDYSMSKSGQLYKGEEVISGKNELVDALKENTEIESSLYFGNRVIISTILRDAGGRITGSNHMPEDIYKTVITEGKEVFSTEVLIQEKPYYAYFKPLINSDGTVAGCIFAGRLAEEVDAQMAKENNKIILYAILVSVIGVVVILLLSQGMVKSMITTKRFIEVVSTGDLRQDVNTKALKRDDELGDMYATSYTLQEALKGIVTNLKSTVDSLVVSSDELMNLSENSTEQVVTLYDSVEFISQGATDQADQTSVAAIQVSNIGDQIDNISTDVTSLTESAAIMAEAEKASTSIINELNESNEEMIGSIEKFARQIEVMNGSVQEIGTAIAMIRAISEETDLLSINASIEAARAGEAGRGFAVVADQINKLAAQSGDNATEIETIINSLLEEYNLMVQYMDDVKVKMSEQSAKLDLTIEQFSAVANGVDTSLVNISNITNGMNELGKSRDVILDVISALSAVSQQYAASTNGAMEAAETMNDAMKAVEDASKKLKNMSDDLTCELEIFKL